MRSRRFLLRTVAVSIFVVRSLYVLLNSLDALSPQCQCRSFDAYDSDIDEVPATQGRSSRSLIGSNAAGGRSS